jgi:hypothetical protein
VLPLMVLLAMMLPFAPLWMNTPSKAFASAPVPAWFSPM